MSSSVAGGDGSAVRTPYVWKVPLEVPKAKGDEVFMPDCNWTLFRSLPNFDIRNGDESDARSMIIKATIPEWSKWSPVADLPPALATQTTEAYIQSALYNLDKNASATMGEKVKRKVAIVLGASRAVMTTHYRLSESDLVPGEVVEPVLRAVVKADGSLGYVPRIDIPAGTCLDKSLELNTTEQAVVCKMALVGLGIPAMQGYSLTMTAHHYLSDKSSPSFKVTVPVEKAYLMSQDVKEWWMEDQDALRDALWHKAGHPIHMGLKQAMASDSRVPPMLQAAGAGACASRLPALEAELRTANSYVTVLAAVRPAFQSYKGDVDTEALDDIIAVVKTFPTGSEPLSDDFVKALPAYVPVYVRSRRTALVWLSEVLSKNVDMVANCYGFYCAMSEQAAMVGGAMGTDTLRASYSLTKLRTQNMSSYMTGTANFQDYNGARNAARAKGTWAAPSYVVKT